MAKIRLDSLCPTLSSKVVVIWLKPENMTPTEKYFPVLQDMLDKYEKGHPCWHTEVFMSLVKGAFRALMFYLEDDKDPKITWDNPFVELHYPIAWNWQKKKLGAVIAPGGHIFGKITRQNTATRALASKTLSKIMANQLNATVLANATNWAWYEKRKNYYTPVLPLQLNEELNQIADKRKRRAYFDQLMAPFSIGACRIDLDHGFKSGARLPKGVQNNTSKKRCAGPIHFSGEINGRLFDTFLVVEVHPLIADYDKKLAYHPIIVGLPFRPTMAEDRIVEDFPSQWPKGDKEIFWKGLFENIGKLPGLLKPEKRNPESVVIAVNTKIKIPADLWRPENRSTIIKLMADAQGQVGEVMEFAVGTSESMQEKPGQSPCNVCHWAHDAAFTQIKVSSDKIISLGGVLPDIVAAVHRAGEKGLALSTKDEELVKLCGSYRHPSKAFDDLKHREDYKILFARKRGFISLRGVTGINSERKSETNPE
jgi:hypothetical protein